MRPLYETVSHLTAEHALADRVAQAWCAQAVKLPRAYPCDYGFRRSGETVALAEFKCRRYPMARLEALGGFMLSLHKWAGVRALAQASGLPFVLVVEDGDSQVWWHRPTDFSHDGVGFGGRRDRDDPQDTEPVITLRAARFRPLRGLP